MSLEQRLVAAAIGGLIVGALLYALGRLLDASTATPPRT